MRFILSSSSTSLRYINITAWDVKDLALAEDLVKAITDPPTAVVTYVNGYHTRIYVVMMLNPPCVHCAWCSLSSSAVVTYVIHGYMVMLHSHLYTTAYRVITLW